MRLKVLHSLAGGDKRTFFAKEKPLRDVRSALKENGCVNRYKMYNNELDEMRMKRKNWMFMFLASVLMNLCFGMTAWAAGWRMGAEPNDNRWWYDYEDGTYAKSGWQWLDGNQDGTAECYYFDSEGWMAADTVTPDGYQVNRDGAWVENGVAVTREAQTQKEEQSTVSANQLIVYFSRTGTTGRAAERIHELTGAQMVRIEAVESYPSSYESTLSRAERELDTNARPAITALVDHMDQYDTVYVGFPIWYGTAPMPVFTFLEMYDLSGKTIVPFCTSGGSGVEPVFGISAEAVRIPM